MNQRTKGVLLPACLYQFKTFPILVAFLFILVPGLVKGQRVESRPISRMIGPGSSMTRPRRVTSSNTSVTSRTPVGLECEEANPVELRAFEQTNIERVKHGLPAFVWDSDLMRMARQHSENMARSNFFSHVTPQGVRLRDRARSVGIVRYTVLGENIAYNLGYDDHGAFAVERWMISPGHRANILSPEFKAMAVGTFVGPDGAVFLTQTFITR